MKGTYLMKRLRPLQVALLSAGAISLMVAAGPVSAADQSNGSMDQQNAPGAVEQQGSGQESADFSQLDTNHDGYISPDEARANSDLESGFSQADTNKDGEIDQSEFSAFEAQGQNMQEQPSSPNTEEAPSDNESAPSDQE